MRIAVQFKHTAGGDDESVVVGGGGGGIDRRGGGETIEEGIVRGTSGEFDGAQVDGGGAGVAVAGGGIEQQLAVTGLGEASGGGGHATAERDIESQGGAAAVGVEVPVRGGSRGGQRAGTGNGAACLGQHTTRLNLQVAEGIDGERSGVFDGQRVDAVGGDASGDGTGVQCARHADVGIRGESCGRLSCRDRPDAVGGIVGGEHCGR